MFEQWLRHVGRYATLWTLVLGVLLSGSMGCKELDDSEAKGQVVLALQGDMSFPEDVDAVAVYAWLDGDLAFERTYRVAPSGPAKLPALVHLGEGYASGTPLVVRVYGLSEGHPIVVAKAETSVPEDREALLALSLHWLCREDLGEGELSELDGRCGGAKTCSAGACVSSKMPAEDLPDYESKLVYGAEGPDDPRAQCFPTAACFDLGEPLSADEDCVVTLFVPEGREPNFGLRMAEGEGGIEGDSGRYIALDEGSSGWALVVERDVEGGTEVKARLPQAACAELDEGTVADVLGTVACPTKVAALPTCGPWSIIEGEVVAVVLHSEPERDAGAQTESDSGSPDNGSPDSGADSPTLEIVLASGETLGPVALNATLALEVDGVDVEEATWSSSNEDVATVEDGVITTHALGEATIRVEFGGQWGEIVITVAESGLGTTLSAHLVALRLEVEGAELPESLIVNEELEVLAVGTYSNGVERELTDDVTWAATPAGLIEIVEPGVLLARSVGLVEVTASREGISVGTEILVVAPMAGGGDSDASAPPVAAPQRLTLSAAPEPLWPGQSFAFVATLIYDDNSVAVSPAGVQWQSADPSVALVSGTGVVTGVAAGTTFVTATLGAVSVSKAVAVTLPELVTLTVDPLEPLALHAFEQLKATGQYADGSQAELSDSVVWSSSDESIVRVSSGGLLSALGPGSAQVAAAVGGLSATLDVTVVTIDALTLSVQPVAPTPVGRQVQLSAVANANQGAPVDVTGQTTWISSDSSVVQVSADGLATAKGEGTTTVTASYEGVIAELEFTALAAVAEQLVVTPSSAKVGVGTSYALSATLRFSDGSTEPVGASATWSSSDSSIVTVGSTGVVSGVFAGTATVTASVGDLRASSAVTVENVVPDEPKPDLQIVPYGDGGLGRQGEVTAFVLVPARSDQSVPIPDYPSDSDSQRRLAAAIVPIDFSYTQAAEWSVNGGSVALDGPAYVHHTAARVVVTAVYEGFEYRYAFDSIPIASVAIVLNGEVVSDNSEVDWGSRYLPWLRVYWVDDASRDVLSNVEWETSNIAQNGPQIEFDQVGSASLTGTFANKSATVNFDVQPLASDIFAAVPRFEAYLEDVSPRTVGEVLATHVYAVTEQATSDVSADAVFSAIGATATPVNQGESSYFDLDLHTVGTVEVTVSWGGLTKEYTIEVVPQAVLRIVPVQLAHQVEVRGTLVLSAQLEVGETITPLPSDAVTWGSSSESLPVVDGAVTGGPIGSYTVTASYGELNAETEVEVVPVWTVLPAFTSMPTESSRYLQSVLVDTGFGEPSSVEIEFAGSGGAIGHDTIDGPRVSAGIEPGVGYYDLTTTIGNVAYTHRETVEVYVPQE